MRACMDACGNLGLASLRLQSVTTAMCACACVVASAILSWGVDACPHSVKGEQIDLRHESYV